MRDILIIDSTKRRKMDRFMSLLAFYSMFLCVLIALSTSDLVDLLPLRQDSGNLSADFRTLNRDDVVTQHQASSQQDKASEDGTAAPTQIQNSLMSDFLLEKVKTQEVNPTKGVDLLPDASSVETSSQKMDTQVYQSSDPRVLYADPPRTSSAERVQVESSSEYDAFDEKGDDATLLNSSNNASASSYQNSLQGQNSEFNFLNNETRELTRLFLENSTESWRTNQSSNVASSYLNLPLQHQQSGDTELNPPVNSVQADLSLTLNQLLQEQQQQQQPAHQNLNANQQPSVQETQQKSNVQESQQQSHLQGTQQQQNQQSSNSTDRLQLFNNFFKQLQRNQVQNGQQNQQPPQSMQTNQYQKQVNLPELSEVFNQYFQQIQNQHQLQNIQQNLSPQKISGNQQSKNQQIDSTDAPQLFNDYLKKEHASPNQPLQKQQNQHPQQQSAPENPQQNSQPADLSKLFNEFLQKQEPGQNQPSPIQQLQQPQQQNVPENQQQNSEPSDLSKLFNEFLQKQEPGQNQPYRIQQVQQPQQQNVSENQQINSEPAYLSKLFNEFLQKQEQGQNQPSPIQQVQQPQQQNVPGIQQQNQQAQQQNVSEIQQQPGNELLSNEQNQQQYLPSHQQQQVEHQSQQTSPDQIKNAFEDLKPDFPQQQESIQDQPEDKHQQQQDVDQQEGLQELANPPAGDASSVQTDPDVPDQDIQDGDAEADNEQSAEKSRLFTDATWLDGGINSKEVTPEDGYYNDDSKEEEYSDTKDDLDPTYDTKKWAPTKTGNSEEEWNEGPSSHDDHMIEQVVDAELAKRNRPPTAPTNMVLFYTWMIVAVLVFVVGISMYQARCRGLKISGNRSSSLASSSSGSSSDKKRLLDHEFV